MKLPRLTILHLVVVVAVVAADFAALRPYLPLEISIFWTSYPWSVIREALPPRFPNLGIVVVVLLLEVGLFRLTSVRGGARAFWMGFEVAGWTLVVAASALAKPIWWWSRRLFEDFLMGRQIGRSLDMGRLVFLVGGLHLLIVLAISVVIGIISRSVSRRWEDTRIPV